MNPHENDFSTEQLAMLRSTGLYVWNSTVIFVSLLYLTGDVIKPLLIGGFVFVSCLLGYGHRRLTQLGAAMAVITIFVSYGFPTPDRWLDLAKSVPAAVSYAWNHTASH